MLKRLLDRYHDHRRGYLAVDSKTPPEAWIGADPGSAVDPVGLVRAGNQKDQPDARVLHQILEAVYPIVAPPVRDQQCAAVILDLDKTRLVAFGGAVEPFTAAGCQDKKGRSGDEGASCRIDVIDLFSEDAFR